MALCRAFLVILFVGVLLLDVCQTKVWLEDVCSMKNPQDEPNLLYFHYNMSAGLSLHFEVT
ncbi:MAG: hypothetical protein DRR08_17320 [Candidatus Parabeggiatoa sp. nov. 2]|nr:MAG: hypothetical protein B6247_28460 [Beggiatoa sp. 4572_84]RKZ58073.1 MAG: hypothetical protein DRR08_17320 [Gammaproteobacteria bacterium]